MPVCELLGPGKQRDAVTVLGYLFYIGDRTKTDLPYLESTPGSHEWYRLRHQEALDSDAVVRLAEASQIATALKILNSRAACCRANKRLIPFAR